MATQGGAENGTRRIDRVLSEGFLAGMGDLPLDELRGLRGEAEQEEVDLSYLRRLVQGRLDLVRAELNRRDGGGAPLIEELPEILADEPRLPPRGLGRHATVEPSRIDSHRRYVESLVADVELSDLASRTNDQLARAMDVFSEEEQQLSIKRRQVQEVLDLCSAEITRRYRDGEADVGDLLTGPSAPES